MLGRTGIVSRAQMVVATFVKLAEATDTAKQVSAKALATWLNNYTLESI